MLRLLALGNNLSAVIPVVSREFECSQAVVYKDYERMSTWVKIFVHDNQLTILLRVRLDILIQEEMKIILDESIRNPYVKIAAINAALKITKEQIKLGIALGLIKRKPFRGESASFSAYAF